VHWDCINVHADWKYERISSVEESLMIGTLYLEQLWMRHPSIQFRRSLGEFYQDDSTNSTKTFELSASRSINLQVQIQTYDDDDDDGCS